MNDETGYQAFKGRLDELELSIKGLSMEVEAGRVNASSNADFILFTLEKLLREVKALRDAL